MTRAKEQDWIAVENYTRVNKEVIDFVKEEASQVMPKEHPWNLDKIINGIYENCYNQRDRFQWYLYGLIRIEKPEIIVETGVEYGISTKYMLEALCRNKKGHLHSIDPSRNSWEIEKYLAISQDNVKRWTLHKAMSVNAFQDLAEKFSPWDIFIHDSDHEVECQTLEYEFGYRYLKPGGYIISDDYGWVGVNGGEPHGAWPKFIQRHGLTWRTIGSASIARKPFNAKLASREPKQVFKNLDECIILAQQAVREYRIAGLSPLTVTPCP